MSALLELKSRIQACRSDLGKAKQRLNRCVIADLNGRADPETLVEARAEVAEIEAAIKELEAARTDVDKLEAQDREKERIAGRAQCATALKAALAGRREAAAYIVEALDSIAANIRFLDASDSRILQLANPYLSYDQPDRKQEAMQNLQTALGYENRTRWMMGAMYDVGVRDHSLSSYRIEAKEASLPDIVDRKALHLRLTEAVPELEQH